MLAPLAHARFTPETSSGVISLATPQRSAEPMSVITSIAEARIAVDTAAASATRMLSIYTQDLEPEVYDQTPFLEIIKSFVLARSFAKVRVLLVDPTRVMTDTNRFIAMGRRLSTYIDIRYVASHMPQQRSCAYLIADERAIVYRLRADTWTALPTSTTRRSPGCIWPSSTVSGMRAPRSARCGSPATAEHFSQGPVGYNAGPCPCTPT